MFTNTVTNRSFVPCGICTVRPQVQVGFGCCFWYCSQYWTIELLEDVGCGATQRLAKSVLKQEKHLWNTTKVHDRTPRINRWCWSGLYMPSQHMWSLWPFLLLSVAIYILLTEHLLERVLKSFHFLNLRAYEKIFPKSKLNESPKPWLTYAGWTLIRDNVLKTFSFFKDVECRALLNLLYNYIILVLSVYSISFTQNNVLQNTFMQSSDYG